MESYSHGLMEDGHVELIDNGVPPSEQKMTSEKVFWVFFTPNICITTWIFGILVAQGNGFYSALIAIILGNTIGTIPVALAATMGPQTRLTSLEGSRYSFGKRGVKLPAFLNWVNSIGWDAVNNIPAATALSALMLLYGWHSAFWIPLALLSLIQMVIAIYGHHLVQLMAKYLGYLIAAIFLFIGIRAYIAVGGIPVDHAAFSIQAFMLAVSLSAVNVAGYGPYAADYTRYLPAQTSKASIFWKVFAGIMISCIVVMVFGLITASAIKDPTPDSVVTGLEKMAGAFAPLVLLATGLGVIPVNAMNDNSGAYCLVSAGIRIPRYISAVIASVVGFFIALYGAGNLTGVITDVILLLFYWIAPWTGIVLVHWFMTGMHEEEYPIGWTNGASIFCVVTLVTVALFASNDLYTGPIAKMLGGVDIGFYIGFFLAAFLYWLTLRSAKIKIPLDKS